MTHILCKGPGGWLRNARKRNGLSQSELADAAGVSRQAIAAIESGRGSVRTLERVAPVLNFRVVGLAEGSTTGAQLAKARRQRGWSQGELAVRAGLSVPTIRSLERGGGSGRSFSAALAVLAPDARANTIARASWHVRDDVRFTPPELLDEVVRCFGRISLDVAGDPRSYVEADRIITEEEDGLTTSWAGDLGWCNPPFSSLSKWLHRCADAWNAQEVKALLGLFPARRETVAFRTRIEHVADVIPLPRRLRFYDQHRQRLAPSPFGVMLVAWGIPRDRLLEFARRNEATVMFAEDVRRSRSASISGAACGG